MTKGAHCFAEVNERLCWVYSVLLQVLLSQRCRRCDGSSSRSLGLREIGQNQRKPSVFKASDLCPYYNRRVDPSHDSSRFHIVKPFLLLFFSWQKLAPGVVFPYGSWLCWKKLRSGNCGKARWVRSVIRLSLRGPSAGAHSVQEGKTVLLLGPPHDTGKAAVAFRSCPRKVPEGLAAEPVPCPARLPRDLSLPSLIPPGA